MSGLKKDNKWSNSCLDNFNKQPKTNLHNNLRRNKTNPNNPNQQK